MIGKDFEANIYNPNIPKHVRASCPEELWKLFEEEYGEEEAFKLCTIQNERPPITI